MHLYGVEDTVLPFIVEYWTQEESSFLSNLKKMIIKIVIFS